jgi:predicted Zn-dependent peptidase
MEIIKKTTQSGLRTLRVLSEDTESVTIMFLVNVGSRYEKEEEKGLAHFVEHTLFKGTQARPSSKQIGMEIESLGGSSNAFTSYDYTGYYIKSPAINFEKSFAVLADMFSNSVFADSEIEKERGVIIEEIRMYEDRPTSKVVQEWGKNFYQGNSLGELITGNEESVRNMKREQFLNFVKQNYFAENVLIIVSGNVAETLIDEAVTKYCSGIKSSIEIDASPNVYGSFVFHPAETRKKDEVIQKDLNQAHIVLGGQAFSRKHPKRFALNVANTILGSGFGSRLFQVIRDELGLAYYVYSRLSQFDDSGVYNIGLGADKARVNEAIEAVKKQLVEITEGKFTQEEFDRAKNYLLGNMITELETSEDIAMFYGMQELLQEEKLTIEDVKNKILAIQIKDVVEVAHEVYVPDNLFSTVLTSA